MFEWVRASKGQPRSFVGLRAPYLRGENPRLIPIFIRIMPRQKDICTTDLALRRGSPASRVGIERRRRNRTHSPECTRRLALHGSKASNNRDDGLQELRTGVAHNVITTTTITTTTRLQLQLPTSGKVPSKFFGGGYLNYDKNARPMNSPSSSSSRLHLCVLSCIHVCLLCFYCPAPLTRRPRWQRP